MHRQLRDDGERCVICVQCWVQALRGNIPGEHLSEGLAEKGSNLRWDSKGHSLCVPSLEDDVWLRWGLEDHALTGYLNYC